MNWREVLHKIATIGVSASIPIIPLLVDRAEQKERLHERIMEVVPPIVTDVSVKEISPPYTLLLTVRKRALEHTLKYKHMDKKDWQKGIAEGLNKKIQDWYIHKPEKKAITSYTEAGKDYLRFGFKIEEPTKPTQRKLGQKGLREFT